MESIKQFLTEQHSKPSTHELNKLTHGPNCILLLYKLTLPTCNINNTGFVGLEVCAIGNKCPELILCATGGWSLPSLSESLI
jgi:hypothetical protein